MAQGKMGGGGGHYYSIERPFEYFGWGGGKIKFGVIFEFLTIWGGD